jgi:acyl-CoA thioesterase-2
MTQAPDLKQMLTLERIERDLFRGYSTEGGQRLFGGLVIAQALMAGYSTVSDRLCHSLHAYFLRAGDVSIPVLYEVDRARDGGSFTARRVIAVQNGEQILNLAASFQKPEEGLEHQVPMPSAPAPESLPTEAEYLATFANQLPPEKLRHIDRMRAIELRWIDPQSPVQPVKKPSQRQIWMRAKIPLPDLCWQQVALAYASDIAFLEAALRVHGLHWTDRRLQGASLDHALWFHRPFDFTEWHLFAQEAPSTSQGRGLVRGFVYSRDGTLVASMVQECLIRLRT